MMVEIHTETGSPNKNQKHKVVLTVYIWYHKILLAEITRQAP
jgi:hypothetical protein